MNPQETAAYIVTSAVIIWLVIGWVIDYRIHRKEVEIKVRMVTLQQKHYTEIWLAGFRKGRSMRPPTGP
jgi:hypothetical protein